MVTLMETAKMLIEEFCVNEYGDEGADFSDMENIPVAYTEYIDDKGEMYEVQVIVDLVNCRLIKMVNNSMVLAREYNSLEDFIKADLSYLDFDELVDVSDWADKSDIDLDITAYNLEEFANKIMKKE